MSPDRHLLNLRLPCARTEPGLQDGLGIDFMAKMGHGNPDGKLIERWHYALCRCDDIIGPRLLSL